MEFSNPSNNVDLQNYQEITARRVAPAQSLKRNVIVPHILCTVDCKNPPRIHLSGQGRVPAPAYQHRNNSEILVQGLPYHYLLHNSAGCLAGLIRWI